jgi:hypothetical protein
MDDRPSKDIVIDTDGEKKTKSVGIGTEDILAVFAGLIALGILLGIVFGKIEATWGGGIIVALVGAASIAKIAKAKRSVKKNG